MGESPVIETALAGYTDPTTDAGDAAGWRRGLGLPFNDILRFDVDISFLGLELGDKVTLADFPLLDASTSARVIGIDVAITDRRLTLTLFVKRDTDPYSAAYITGYYG